MPVHNLHRHLSFLRHSLDMQSHFLLGLVAVHILMIDADYVRLEILVVCLP